MRLYSVSIRSAPYAKSTIFTSGQQTEGWNQKPAEQNYLADAAIPQGIVSSSSRMLKGQSPGWNKSPSRSSPTPDNPERAS